MPLPQADALGLGPPYLELDLLPGGSNSTTVYVTSGGLSGELIVGREDLPFRVEPSRINMTGTDVKAPVELTFYGNGTLEPGAYVGLVTFTASTGGFIGLRIKLWVTINLLGEVSEFHEDPETPVEEEPERGLEAEAGTEAEAEPERERTSIDISDRPSPLRFIIGSSSIAVLLAVCVIWWRRRR